jgi:tRNA A-37 threonylcarbamoyl transferase component Bud32
MSPRASEQKENLREVMRSIHLIMVENFGAREIKVIPVGDEGSRLSIPIKITGVGEDGEPARYFAKIIGSSDMMTEKTIQFMKNLYLHIESRTPLFGFTHSAEEMARYQFETMTRIGELGIPTAKPLGIFALPGGLWLLLTEFLEFPKLTAVKELSDEQLDEAVRSIHLLHANGIFHGDIKPENFLFKDRVFILDVGNFHEDAPVKEKRAYDLSCLMISFLEHFPPDKVLTITAKYYPKRDLKKATTYFELIKLRPDFHVDEDMVKGLTTLIV